jgi:hypothetical protein
MQQAEKRVVFFGMGSDSVSRMKPRIHRVQRSTHVDQGSRTSKAEPVSASCSSGNVLLSVFSLNINTRILLVISPS